MLEALPAFLGAADEAVAKEAQKRLRASRGSSIHTGVKITDVDGRRRATSPSTTPTPTGKAQTATFDQLIVSIGRVPHTGGPRRARRSGSRSTSAASSTVDAECRTNLPNVWAIGDVVRGPMLAHKAEDEGVAVAERIAGQHGHVDFNTVPWVIYTSPEIAWVGKTEQQLKADGVAYRAGSFPFTANGRARALGDTTGFVKILADAQDRPHPRHAHDRPDGVGADRRRRRRDGVRRGERGPRAHLPRASVAVRGDQGSGAGGGRADAESLA